MPISVESDGNVIVLIIGNSLILDSVTGITGSSRVIVTAIDEQLLSVNDTFMVHIDPGVGITSGQEHPTDFILHQNYPNPFNPSTVIRLQLPVASEFELTVFDTNSKKVRELASGILGAGTHDFEWDGTDDYGQRVASGVYFYRLSHIPPAPLRRGE